MDASQQEHNFKVDYIPIQQEYSEYNPHLSDMIDPKQPYQPRPEDSQMAIATRTQLNLNYLPDPTQEPQETRQFVGHNEGDPTGGACRISGVTREQLKATGQPQLLAYSQVEWMGKTPKQWVMEYYQLQKFPSYPNFERICGYGKKEYAAKITLPVPIHGRAQFQIAFFVSTFRDAEHTLSILVLLWLTNNHEKTGVTAKIVQDDIDALFKTIKREQKAIEHKRNTPRQTDRFKPRVNRGYGDRGGNFQGGWRSGRGGRVGPYANIPHDYNSGSPRQPHPYYGGPSHDYPPPMYSAPPSAYSVPPVYTPQGYGTPPPYGSAGYGTAPAFGYNGMGYY